EYASLFGGDFLQRVAQKVGVIDRNARDDGHQRAVDNVGRIQTPAKAYFQQKDIGRVPREKQQSGRHGEFEYRHRATSVCAFAFFKRCRKFIVGDEMSLAVRTNPEAFIEADKMR